MQGRGMLDIALVAVLVLAIFIGGFGLAFVPALWAGEKGGTSSGVSAGDTSEQEFTKAEWEEMFKNTELLLQIPWEFVAAITFQESGMGNNFGGCSYFPPAPNGHVLVPGNGLRMASDKTNFEKVSEKTGVEKNKGVSCNPSGSNGGAMGYTQVMPTEWVNYSTNLITKTTTYPHPWNAQDALHMAGTILKAKVGLNVTQPFPENESTIKAAAGSYYGCTSCSYKNEVYQKYLDIKSRGHL